MTTTNDFTQPIISQLLTMWTSRNTAVSGFFNKYSNEEYMNEIAPGRNRAVYLLGHLISTNDGLLPLFGLGERLFPELEKTFSSSPDKAVSDIPTMAELKEKWEKINAVLTAHFSTMTATEWMDRHTAVTKEDFAKEPHRNKLNVLIGRTNHQSYHLGQLNLLKVSELVAG